jgi:hypothetical protein
MVPKVVGAILLHAILALAIAAGAASAQNARDVVRGNLIQFNDNGAWCWYQDERAIIDTVVGRMVLGSEASVSGVGGSDRNGDVESVIFDLHSRTSQRFKLRESDPTVFYCDDHNAPAFLLRPDGKYLAMYAAHFGDSSSYYRIYSGGVWGPEHRFNWKTERPGGVNFQTTYSNLYYLSAENRVYNFSRGNNKSPNMMFSTDMGDTWSYGGQLSANANIGYNNGYYKYCSNGIDRIDFICSDYHPRDYNTSIFHGYIKDHKIYRSDGSVADDNAFDSLSIPTTSSFTPVFTGGTVINNDTMYRCWNTDVYRYSDGTIATIVTARVDNNVGGSSGSINPNHSFIYCRFDGSKWTSTYLCKAGLKMYPSEQDYTGLAAIHPNDPNTIYLSTTIDPRDDSNLIVHEIFKGVTANNGATWTWTPITQKSVRDNFRPIIPVWDKNNTALLWWRGTYTSAQSFNSVIVGILDRKSETVEKMIYVDATLSNTTLSTGESLVTTGPDTSAGPLDGKWHLRTGYGNGGTVLTSSEVAGENVPPLKTQVAVPTGVYDVWANFWGNPVLTSDWRIKAGLSADSMQLFRQMACKEVEAGDHKTTLVLTGNGNVFLYQAYLGRVSVKDTIRVFVDDEAIQTGTTGTLAGNTARTWYDGISTAGVDITTTVSEKKELPVAFGLSQNYPNPFNPTTVISYQLPVNSVVTLKVYEVVGREVRTLVHARQSAGQYSIQFEGNNLSSGVYFYRLHAGDFSSVKKLVLMK